MTDNQKSGADEVLEKSVSAANAVKGATKTGKTVSQIAKGTAGGGPYGAIAGAVWENRKVVGKIIIAVIALLMIPVVFITMLPSLIFGGLTDAFSTADTENPILNSSIIVSVSTKLVCKTVDEILEEALENIIAEIKTDFEGSEADQIEINRPDATERLYDTSKLMSVYCASKGDDYDSVSIDDLAQILRDHMDLLYSYTVTEENRPVMQLDPETGALIPVTETDPDTGEKVAVTELWRVYQITFDGEMNFEDQVFSLTEDQKELANDYYDNFNLLLEDENIMGASNSANDSGS